MPIPFRTLCAALLVGAAPTVYGQIALDTIGGVDLTFEGLVQADWNGYDSDVADLDGDPDDDDDSEQDLRTAQFYLKGKGPGNFDWVAGYDGKADKWLDLNARYKFGEIEQFVQAGQFKQPNGLEELSAGKHNDFMSQASISNTFTVGRRLGVGYSYGHPFDRTSGQGDTARTRHGNFGVTASYFGREITSGLGRGSGYGLRGTWAPLNMDGRILHFGLSYVDYDTPADTIRLRARPNADLTPVRLVDTGSFTDSDRVSTVGLESFWIHGPFKLQAEYMSSEVQRDGAGVDDFSGTGGYLSGVWNVNGQSWGYKGGEPATQLASDSRWGSWQLGLRYDVIDLDDNAVEGGRMESLTAGVNWYWRSNFKVVLNYVAVESERDNNNDDPNILEARFQFYW